MEAGQGAGGAKQGCGLIPWGGELWSMNYNSELVLS